MTKLEVALVTSMNGKKYISMEVHRIGESVLMDYYKNAYGVSIIEAKKACEILNIDYQTFLLKQEKEAKEFLQATIDTYGDSNIVDEFGNGLEVMVAKEKLENIKSAINEI